MRLLELPHKTADYLCPVNGLADVYEWKTGVRIPEQLLFYARSGFMLISDKKAAPPKMIFFSAGSIGRKQYEFWGRMMDFELHSGEGKSFGNTLRDVRALIDREIPVIVFGLDMYHLGYHDKFYHKMHVPGHVVLMVGYDAESIFVHDNSKPEAQRILLSDLESAWANPYLNISKKNAYIGVGFSERPRDSREILNSAYREMAETFLNPPAVFFGAKGMKKLIAELPSWNRSFDDAVKEEICRFLVMFTGSVLPILPKELDESDLSGLGNPRRGTRDRFSEALMKYRREFGSEAWDAAAGYFSESGEHIEKIAEGFTQMILNCSYSDLPACIPLFEKLLESEMKAFSQFLLMPPQRG